MSTPSDWVEFCGDGSTSPSNFACEYGQSHAQLVYDIPFNYFVNNGGLVSPFDNGAYNIVGYILGYSDVSADGSLYRYLPLQHPYLQGLYASKITNAVPMVHGGRDEEGHGTGDFKSEGGYDGQSFAIWDFVRTTIYYQTFPYIIMSDTAVQAAPYNGLEVYRYTLPKYEGGIRSLNFGKPGEAKWAEGPDTNSQITSLQPTKVEAYADLTYTWYRVPARGVFKFVHGLPLIPTNIAACLGTVNTNPWPDATNGYPAQTLLCLPPKFIEQTYPVSPSLLALYGSFINDLPVMYDVQFRFKYYDPQPLASGATTRGHNLAPRKDGTYAKYTIAPPGGSGQPIYQSSDFNGLFTLVGSGS